MQTLEEGPARSPGPPPKRPARSQPDCVLSIGFQNLPAAIIEERGGTLVVLIQGSPQFWVDDSGQLKTPETDLEVRVFNMVRVEAEDGDPAGEIPKFRIGLERMGTVANEEADDADGTCADEEERDEGEAALKKAAGIPLLGLFASLLAAVALGGVAWACQHYLRQWIFSPAASHQEQQTDGARNAAAAPAKPSNADAPPALPPVSSLLLGLPGVDPFLQPEVAKLLDLSPEQQDAMQRLHQITQMAVADLEKYWGDDDRLEVAQKRRALLDEARQQALQLLTDSQREQWLKMAR